MVLPSMEEIWYCKYCNWDISQTTGNRILGSHSNNFIGNLSGQYATGSYNTFVGSNGKGWNNLSLRLVQVSIILTVGYQALASFTTGDSQCCFW